MHLMNKIFTEQNKEDILLLQYSARKHYNRAEKLQYAIWGIILANILLNTVLKSCIGDYFMKVFSMLLLILQMFLTKRKYINIKIGAYTKELIDCTLFGFDSNCRLYNYSDQKLKEFAVRKKQNSNDYEIQISNTGKDRPRGVKDWYENRENQDINTAIFGCQCENIWWDEELCERYMYIFLGIVLTLMSAIIYINKDISVFNIIFTVVIPCIQIIIELISQVKNFINLKVYIGKVTIKKHEIQKRLNLIDKESLIELQDLILQRRQYEIIIPNWLHYISALKLHNLREEIND